jgi:DnaJ-class molecular chaperone
VKEGDIILCPDCKGTGKKRDWTEVILMLGIPLLFDKDRCDRCDGAGFIKALFKESGNE